MTDQVQHAEHKDKTSPQRGPAKPVSQGPVALAPAPDLALLQRAIADPSHASPADILALQHLAGNRVVSRLIQTKSNLQSPISNPQAGFDAGPDVESHLAVSRGTGSPLPDDVRATMEPCFGADFGGVRVHTGGEADHLNRQLSAQAFTHGQDIYMAAGKYAPGTPGGNRLLAHELTHVVQQSDVTVRRHPETAAPDRTGTTALDIGQRDESGIRVIRRRNDLEVVAEYQGHQAVGRNGHEDETREAIADRRPRLYNSLENVHEPLERSKFACAEANALGNLLKVVPVLTQNYRDIAFGPAKFIKNATLGEGVGVRFFPKGSNYQRCRNCQQWLAPPDFDKIAPLP